MINSKQIEVFCGTGGVGKTTMATARAIALASQNKSILLITIDPSKRLKQLLNISDEESGEVKKLSNFEGASFDVLLMNPEKTFQRIATKSDHPEIAQNRILKILSRPYGGLNEILSLIEINERLSDQYDTIVLDTPPGSHFLDFLESTKKIKVFFDQSFIEIFQYLGKKIDTDNLPLGKKVVTFFISSGVKKLLGYLKRVTGEKFINDFIEAVQAIYYTKNSFMATETLEEKLKNPSFTNWFLVTSVEQAKFEEALAIKQRANDYLKDSVHLILNKSLYQDLEKWEPATSELQIVRDNLKSREDKLRAKLEKEFSQYLSFPEIYSLKPLDHIRTLKNTWMSEYMKEANG